MATVSEFCKSVIRPSRFLSSKDMTMTQFEDGLILPQDVAVTPQTVGTMVDLYSKVNLRHPDEPITVPLRLNRQMMEEAQMTLRIDDAELEFNRCLNMIRSDDFSEQMRGYRTLTSYEQLYHIGIGRWRDPVFLRRMDDDELQYVQILCDRTLRFFRSQSPYYHSEALWEDTLNDIISRASLDLMSHDTIWDLKISKKIPTGANRIQILTYYILARQSDHPMFKDIRYIGFFNPYLNRSFKYDMAQYDIDKLSILSTMMGLPFDERRFHHETDEPDIR